VLQPVGHLRTRYEQAAEQDLRHDDGGHELNSLELARREGAGQQADRHAHRGAEHGDADHQRGASGSGEPEWPVDDRAGDTGLCRRRGREGDAVAQQQVELGHRRRKYRTFSRAVRSVYTDAPWVT